MATEKSVMAVIRASRPTFRNDYDKVAFAVHASFLAAGFVLVATGPPAFADNALSSSSSNEEVGIDHWNEVEEEYAFLYVNPEKGNKKVLVKCLVIGGKLMVDALSEDSDAEPVHLDIGVEEYVSENAGNDYNSQYKNVQKLVNSLGSYVLAKLYGSSAGSSTSSAPRSSAAEEPNRNADEPGSSPVNPGGFVLPPVNPIGGSDLLPGGGAGMYPTRGDFGGGSMLVGPHDPRWFGERDGHPGVPGGLGVPPGARFDPYGPPGVPGFGRDPPGRFPRGPMPDGGAPPDPFRVPGGRVPGSRIHPDLEQPGSGGFDYI